MKRREIFLVVVLILFGLTYTFFKSEEFTFFDACSSDYRSLLDKNHAHDFVEEGMEFENIKKVILHNPAGNIIYSVFSVRPGIQRCSIPAEFTVKYKGDNLRIRTVRFHPEYSVIRC